MRTHHPQASSLSLTPPICMKHTTSRYNPHPTVAWRPQIHISELPPPHLCRTLVALGGTRQPLPSFLEWHGKRQPPPFRSHLLPTSSTCNPAPKIAPPPPARGLRQTGEATFPHPATAVGMQPIGARDIPSPPTSPDLLKHRAAAPKIPSCSSTIHALKESTKTHGNSHISPQSRRTLTTPNGPLRPRPKRYTHGK